MTSYIDFYKKHNICPVFNKIDSKYLQQRAALYQQLGIVPAFLKGKTILEFGPGNGINSIYTLSLGPKEYLLVDANPKSLENCQKNFSQAFPNQTNYQFIESLIDDFQSDQKFDLVICEGVIPHQQDPASCARKAASFTKEGGLFIHTCHDFISFLSEHLRSFIAFIQSDPTQEFDQKVDSIAEFLKNHFTILKSMSRSHRDWVIDNTMQIEHWQTTPLFSIFDSIETFKSSYSILNSSPQFTADWRWYKNLTDSNNDFLFNEHAQSQFWKNVHNFIDARFVFPERDILENQELYQTAAEVKSYIANYMKDPSDKKKQLLITILKKLKNLVHKFSIETALAIECYLENLERVFEKKPTHFKHFHQWWGRGMQFISLLKVK